MTLLAPTDRDTLERLPSIYDADAFSDAEFLAELERVHDETAIDRKWLEQAELPLYENDTEILAAAAQQKLTIVAKGSGFLAIDRMKFWNLDRSDPSSPFCYSPPYVLPGVAEVMNRIGAAYQADMGASRYLSLTSAVRSQAYQTRLRSGYRKLTIGNPDELSSHQAGLAFDFAGAGLFEADDEENVVRINSNPDNPSVYRPGLIIDSQAVLRQLLQSEQSDGVINFVEELPGTQEHCFHVCVNPDAALG